MYTGVDGSKKCVYFAGNSLGLQPKGTQQFVAEELEKWKTRYNVCVLPLHCAVISKF